MFVLFCMQSGRMYYFNRKSSKKSWNLPENKQKLDLELNISSSSVSNCTSAVDDDESNNKHHLSSASNNNMVALACTNCHLLVILSKSSPSCPNCKFFHSLPNLQTQSSPAKVSGTKSMINTLSLLNWLMLINSNGGVRYENKTCYMYKTMLLLYVHVCLICISKCNLYDEWMPVSCILLLVTYSRLLWY